MARIRLGAVALVLALAALPFGIDWAEAAGEGKAGEEGFTIAEGDNFSLDVHFLIQPTVRKYRKSTLFDGQLYSWLNFKERLTDDPNPVADRVDNDMQSTNTFRMRRARAIFGGRAFAPWIHWRVEMEGFGDNGKAELLDAYLEMGDPKRYALTLGQFKAPFDVFQLTPAWKQLFIERSLVTRTLVPGRDIGVMFSARSEDGRWLARAAIQNGSGRNSSNSDSSLQTAIRLEFQNAGGFEYDLSALARPENTQYAFGLSWLRNNTGTRLDRNTSLFCVDDVSISCTGNSKPGAGFEIFAATRFHEFQLTGSIQRWSFEDMRPWTDAEPTVFPVVLTSADVPVYYKDLNLTSIELQGAVSTSEKFEVVGRLAQLDTDDPRMIPLPFGPAALTTAPFEGVPLVDANRPNLIRNEERVRDWGLGFNYFLRKHNAKVHFGFTQTEVRDKVRDQYFSYVPDSVPAGYYEPTAFDYKIRNGKIFRRNASFNAMVTFYL